MDNTEKVVNGFRFLPPSLGAWFAKDIPDQPFRGDIPWTPLKKPINKTTFTLMTSAGISMKNRNSPSGIRRKFHRLLNYIWLKLKRRVPQRKRNKGLLVYYWRQYTWIFF